MLDHLQVWGIPLAIALIWILFLTGKILMFPLKILFRLSLLALPIWLVLNWDSVRQLVKG